ncbi:MAG: phosphoglycerate dehydrogenase [Myxococcota bacterium]|nr:phosphoglycerate dehydrogenase [Myxococcota bacterium]
MTTSFPSPNHAVHIEGALRVLLLENIHPSAVELLNQAGFQVEQLKTALRPGELTARLQGVHVLGIRSKTTVVAEAIAGAKDLLAVGAFCIGTNQIDLDTANTYGVPVFNAPFSNTRSVAELVIAEIVMLSRRIADRIREMHQGAWRKLATGSKEVRGKTLGIVGYGHIGSQVGLLAESMGMRVVYFDIASKLPLGNARPVANLEEVLEQSDFVTLHVPATPQTQWMIGAEQIARMRPGAILLNLSRGTVVVIEALAEGLRSGHLGGAAVDVFPSEPDANSSDGWKTELQGLPNVILTPHIGGSTEEAQESIGREVATSLTRFIQAGATTGAVNFPQVELASARKTHRIMNVHRNVPGVLRDINKIVSDLNANIHAQMLATDPNIGYLIMDLDQDVARSVAEGIAGLQTDIKTRVVY